MAVTRIKANQITDLNVTTPKINDLAVTAGKLANNLTYGSNLTVTGNLTVNGATVTVDTTNTTIADPIILLSSGATGAPSVDGGMLIGRGDEDNAGILFDNSEVKWKFITTTDDGTTAGNVTAAAFADMQAKAIDGTVITASTNFAGNITGNVTGNVTGTLDGIVGGTTPAAVTGTTVTANTGFVGPLDGILGGNTPAAVTGTVITANTNFAGNITGNVTGNVTGTQDGIVGGTTPAAVTGTTITANTGFVGPLDGILGGNTPAAATGTTITANTGFVGPLDGIVGGSTPAAVTGTVITANTNFAGDITGDVTGNVTAGTGTSSFNAVDINGALTAAGITFDASSTIDAGTNKIVNVVDPTANQDAATKKYVDDNLSGAANTITQGDSNVTVTDSGSNGVITFNIDGAAEGTINASGFTLGNINIDGNTIKSTSGDITIDPTPDGSGGNLIVAGNLTVQGTTTTVNSTTVSIADPVFQIGADSNDALDRGIKALYNDGASKLAYFGMDDSASNLEFVYIPDATDTSSVFSGSLGSAAFGSMRVTDLTATRVVFAGASGELSDASTLVFNDGTGALTATSFVGALTGNVTGNVTGTQDGIVGGTTPAAVTGTTITANTGFVGPLDGILGGNTPAAVTGTTITANTGFVGDLTGDVDGIVGGTTPANVTGTLITANTRFVGAIDGILGGNTPAAVTGTTITANTGFVGPLDGVLGGNTPAAVTGTVITASTNFAGDITGDVTGDVTGDLTGSVTAGAGKTVNITGGTLTLDDDAISGDKINGGIISTFASTGIDDNATSTQVTITDTSAAFGAAVTAATGIVGGTTATTGATFKVASTDSMMLPVGTSAQRPGTGVAGMFRFNSTSGAIEVYTGSEWNSGSDFTVIAANAFAGDDSTTAFTLSVAGTTATTIVALNGVVQIPTTAYAISNTTLTFTEAPATGDVIDARVLTTTSTVTQLAGDDGQESVVIDSSGNQVLIKVGGSTVATFTSGGLQEISSSAVSQLDTSVTVSDTGTGNIAFNVDNAALLTMSAGSLLAASSYTPTSAYMLSTKKYVDDSVTDLVASAPGTLDTLNELAAALNDDASFSSTINTALTARLQLAGGTMSGDINMGGNNITNAGTFSGTATSAQYADLAEMYKADAAIAPGTVVAFGGDAEVTTAMEDGTKKVAGIVSTNPAYLMNSDAEGVAVALTGRVPAKVTGKIAKGDMLVAAGNGMARAEADPKMGQVIGKALEDFDGAEGVIEVVVGRM